MAKNIANKDWCAKSTVRMVRMSPRKVNVVASMIRGLSISEAISLLHVSQKKSSMYIRKCLLSCIANAKSNTKDEPLYVSECYVGKNITLKRLYYCNKGKRGIVRKEFSQITVILKKEESTTYGSKS